MARLPRQENRQTRALDQRQAHLISAPCPTSLCTALVSHSFYILLLRNFILLASKDETWLISVLFNVIPVSASDCCFLDFSPEKCSTDLELSAPIWCEDVKSISFPWDPQFVSSARGRWCLTYISICHHIAQSVQKVFSFLMGDYSFIKSSCMNSSWKIQFRGSIVKNSVSLYTLLSPHFFCHLTPIMGC